MKLGIFAVLACAALPLAAHHSFNSMYDESKVVTLQGVITKVEWMNPHARFWIDVKDSNGKNTSWEVELGSPNGLMRSGALTRALLAKGDPITVEGWPAKETANLAAAGTLTLANGQVVTSDPHWGPVEGMKR